MVDNPPLNGAQPGEFATNNHGDGNATYNHSTIHNTYTNSIRPQCSGIDFLARYIAPTALHSSEARNDCPGCLEGTRVAAIEDLCRWVQDPSKKHHICWVYGGAGVGKSAIAQTICENLREKSQLAASFFFSRNDSSRSTLDPFIPTVAYQLATSPPLRKAGLSSPLDDVARQSPNGVEGMNFKEQFQSLVFQPCVQINARKWKTLPKLVVIDGLDECMGSIGVNPTGPAQAQETLLSIIHKATSAESPLPLQFMIFSRPEPKIRDFFQNIPVSHKSVDMRNFRAQADSDVRKYLQKKFADLPDSQPELLMVGRWPGEQAVERLVFKADGHFIYVVTAMKYITADNPSLADLQERLDTVLHTENTTSYPDLSDLDQLYHTILRRFGRGDLHRQLLLPILRLMITPQPRGLAIGAPHSSPNYVQSFTSRTTLKAMF
ncbi:hypothetical protein PQX77_008707 [Marasmius sp. AFHP31]|nr:hypothetical protein PQX77_008707 [Marasmius sp. AFHP31]